MTWQPCDPPTHIGRGSLGYVFTLVTRDGYRFWRTAAGLSVAMRTPDGRVVRANNQGSGDGLPADENVRQLLAMERA